MADDGVGRGMFIGFLTGALVGSITALLYAPKSGKELRSELRERGDEFVEDAEQYIAKARDRANALINDGKERSEKLVADAKTKVNSLLNEAEKILDDAKKKTESYYRLGRSKVNAEGDRIKSAIQAGVDTYRSEKEA